MRWAVKILMWAGWVMFALAILLYMLALLRMRILFQLLAKGQEEQAAILESAPLSLLVTPTTALYGALGGIVLLIVARLMEGVRRSRPDCEST